MSNIPIAMNCRIRFIEGININEMKYRVPQNTLRDLFNIVYAKAPVINKEATAIRT